MKWKSISFSMLLACLIIQAMPAMADGSTDVTGTVPLVTYNVSAISITINSANITWQTNGNATSEVFYDTMAHADIADYAANVTDNTPVSMHNVPLTGLSSSTTYHYRVKSATNGTEAVSDDYTFTTLAPPPTTPTAPSGPGGGGPAAAPPGITFVSFYVNDRGKFFIDVTAKSADGKVLLIIAKDTIGKTEQGEPLSQISIIETEEPLAPPADASVVGLVYDIGPYGATCEPPVTLIINYDPADVPEVVSEEDMSIAMWDEDAGQWVVLEGSTVDPVANTITAPISRFTAFTVLAYTRPASFTTTNLSISPGEVDIVEPVTISVLVTNDGGLSGRYTVILRINNVVVAAKQVIVAGDSSELVTFTTSQNVAGSYTVTIGELSGTFTVKAAPVPPPTTPVFITSTLTISPTEVKTGELITISARITNTGDATGTYTATLKIDDTVVDAKDVTLAGGSSQMVTFTTSQDVAGSYTIYVDGLSGTFTVKAIINWLLIVIVITSGVVSGVVIQQLILSRYESRARF